MFCLYTLPQARPAQAKIQMLMTRWRVKRSNLLSLVKFSQLYKLFIRNRKFLLRMFFCGTYFYLMLESRRFWSSSYTVIFSESLALFFISLLIIYILLDCQWRSRFMMILLKWFMMIILVQKNDHHKPF